MPKAGLPEPLDLERLFLGAGLFNSQKTPEQELLDLEGALADAVKEFETQAKWKPLVAKPTSLARTFDPPLGAEEASRRFGTYSMGFPTGLPSGVDWVGGSDQLALNTGLLRCDLVGLNGVTQTPGVDYWLSPSDALQREMPYRYIQFRRPVFGPPQSLVITGIWGRFARKGVNLGTEEPPVLAEDVDLTVPNDVWNRILERAASSLLPQVMLAYNNATQLVSWSEAGVSEKYRDNPFGEAGKTWDEKWEKAVADYRRVVL